MISVQEALASVLDKLPRLGSEQVAITHARGRVLAESVTAACDVPPFPNSALDGYAVRASDVAQATAGMPATLHVLETVGAGAVPTQRVARGTAIRIMTGAMIPDGADTIVRVEDTETTGDTVVVRAAPAQGNAVRHAGEDVRTGDTVLQRGRTLRPADIGLLVSVGCATVRVARRPRVAILSTGDELVDVGQPLRPGQIVNSNAYTLAAAVEEGGALPSVIGIVRDQPELIRGAFADALSADVVLSTGGVSVGNFDYVRDILAALGYQERFWKVAQKPGKPLTFGMCRGVPVFGLPGNPVSSLVCFYVYVLPALRTMVGREHVHLPTTMARLSERVKKSAGLTEFIRCALEGGPGDYRVRSTGSQSSGVLRSLSLGDGLIVAPPEPTVLEAGSSVRVIMLAADRGSAAAPV